MADRRKFFRQGELPLVLLALIARRRFNGYELLDELDRLFGPRYRPSPGGVYPALRALLDEGLIRSVDASSYELSGDGRSALSARTVDLADIELRTGIQLSGEGVQAALDRFVAAARGFEGFIPPDEVESVLEEALGRLRKAADKKGADHGRRVR